jgi:SAM-dependent methyltransferase
MNLVDIVQRAPDPEPWAEGDNIPWFEPEFSRRMLKEHLSQDHDAASRRMDIIEDQLDWIHNQVLRGKTSRILDLGCGPGLYSNRLAQYGHTCTGIDFSPASVEYAQAHAAQNCTFRLDDIRTADFGLGYNLAMLIYGEFNVFRPEHASNILRKAYNALEPGGQVLLEPHTFAAVKRLGEENNWSAQAQGLFSERPHLLLTEGMWNEESKTMTTRFFLVDAESGEVTRYAHSYQAYTTEDYERVLLEAGFYDVQFYPGLGEKVNLPGHLMAIVASKE